MRALMSNEKFAAVFRAKAKAARGKATKAAKITKQIDYLSRFFSEELRVKLYYCSTFRFWRICRAKPCLRARDCKGDADACLRRSLHTVPPQEIRQAYSKLLKAKSHQLGPPEREVRMTWPADFWRKPVNPLLVEKAVAEETRRREVEQYMDDQMNPYGPDGLAPVRRSRRR